ncbi:MAG: AI-2E family transporter [Psychrilyobacter sp.]|nr:AI-2E family transporter [Psychrilyobacter sp.]
MGKINGESGTKKAVNIFIKISFIALLFIWSFSIVKPMFMPTLWGMIIAVGVYPFHSKLKKLLGGKDKTSALIVVLLGLGVIIIPISLFAGSFIDGIEKLAINFKGGTITIPVISEEIKSIPIIGNRIEKLWSFLTGDIKIILEKLAPQLQEYAPKVLGLMAKMAMTIGQMIISVLISGVFLINGEKGKQVAKKTFKFLIGDFVEDFHGVASGTIKSVVAGVVGIAAIQGVLAGIGMLLAGVPGAGIWAVLVMILAIIQLPPFILLAPIAIYVYSTSSLAIGVIYIVWTIMISFIDNLLKPLLMGRGVDIPMLVILLGSIGGMLSYGIIGLFVGPVILALVYRFIIVLLEKE